MDKTTKEQLANIDYITKMLNSDSDRELGLEIISNNPEMFDKHFIQLRLRSEYKWILSSASGNKIYRLIKEGKDMYDIIVMCL